MISKVLVVDDESDIRNLFSKLLEKEKFYCKTAVSGEEALGFVEKEDFDIILLDVKLPGISGVDTLKALKEKKPNLPVIMITGFGYDEDLINDCKKLGCIGYIGKNMPVSQIISSFKMFAEKVKGK